MAMIIQQSTYDQNIGRLFVFYEITIQFGMNLMSSVEMNHAQIIF